MLQQLHAADHPVGQALCALADVADADLSTPDSPYWMQMIPEAYPEQLIVHTDHSDKRNMEDTTEDKGSGCTDAGGQGAAEDNAVHASLFPIQSLSEQKMIEKAGCMAPLQQDWDT